MICSNTICGTQLKDAARKRKKKTKKSCLVTNHQPIITQHWFSSVTASRHSIYQHTACYVFPAQSHCVALYCGCMLDISVLKVQQRIEPLVELLPQHSIPKHAFGTHDMIILYPTRAPAFWWLDFLAASLRRNIKIILLPACSEHCSTVSKILAHSGAPWMWIILLSCGQAKHCAGLDLTLH
jgi:hypothetical protein